MTNPHVLLVTPADERSLAPLRRALRDEGYALRLASNAEAALEMARQNPPVAIILDVDIQSKNDLLLCHWLRADPATAAVNVLVTAPTPKQRLVALEAGADELLTPPLDWVEVQARLRTLQAGQAHQPRLQDTPRPTPDLLPGPDPADISDAIDMLNHDLNNPLGVAASSLELLREYAQDRWQENPQLSEQEMQLAENALLACRRLLFLINDMLDLTRIEAGVYSLNLEPLDLVAVAREVMAENAAAIAQKAITVTLEAAPPLPPAVGDYGLLKRICNALLDNALKFTHAQDQVTFFVQAKDAHLELHVCDHGRPILPAYQHSIFERVGQWDARQRGSRTSVALELPFARAAARSMRGDLLAYSDPTGQTTTFCLVLPRAETA